MKIVNSEQMRNLEQAAVREGIRTETLMENAGLAFAEAIPLNETIISLNLQRNPMPYKF